MTPRNLLTTRLSHEQLETELRKTPLASALPAFGDARWEKAATQPAIRRQAEQFVDFATAEASQPLPQLTPAMFRAYEESGERGTFDRCYLERRRLLGQAAVAALLRPDDSTLRDALFRRWEKTLQESSWTGNIHKASDPEADKPDLKATEAAATLAEICAAFRQVAPSSLVEQTEQRLQRMLGQYIASSDPPETWFTARSNWNAVCHYGIVSIGLNLPTSPKKLAEMFFRMSQWLPYYLEGFPADGGCSEGPAYWSYGFSRFAWLNHAVETASAGRWSLIEGDAHIPKIAQFGIRMFVPPEGQINFADAPANGQPCPALISYLADRLGRTDLIVAARELWRLHLNSVPNWRARNTRRLHFLQLSRRFLFAPATLHKTRTPRWPVRQFYLPQLQIWNIRGVELDGKQWSVAAKGGHNNEAHNHNDCGSYVVHLDGLPLIAELGMPQYDKRFFGPHRYDSLAAGSQGHSVPLVNGLAQIPGESAASAVLGHSLNPGYFSLDLTRCYPEAGGHQRITRTFTLERQPFRLIIEDAFQLVRPVAVESALITFGRVTQYDDQTATIESNEQRLLLTVSAPNHLAALEEKSFIDDVGITHPVQRIVIRPVSPPTLTAFIKYSLTISS